MKNIPNERRTKNIPNFLFTSFPIRKNEVIKTSYTTRPLAKKKRVNAGGIRYYATLAKHCEAATPHEQI